MNRNDGIDSQFGGFLNHPFETIELDQGRQQNQPDRGFGCFDLFEYAEPDLMFTEPDNFRQIGLLVVGKFVALADFGA